MGSTVPENKLLVLIDGSALAYRAHFALIRSPLINSHGENTSAVYAFTQALQRLLEQIKPSHLVCVFDTKAPTFRHEIYPEYKSTRAKMPPELADALPWIKDVVNGFNIACIEKEGYEADDIIGTMAIRAAQSGFKVGLLTGDKDFYQLVDDKINVINPKTFEWIGPEDVKRQYGVEPDKMIDLLALMGDSSDNVPGIPGVGEKTAAELLNQFGDLRTTLDSADKYPKKKIAESLKNNAESAWLSRKLVTIERDVPIEFDLDCFAIKEPDKPRLVELFKRFEFKSLAARYSPEQGNLELMTPSADKAVSYRIVESLDQLNSILSEAEKKGECAIDTETTSLDQLQAEIVGISLCFQEGRAFYVPLAHEETSRNLPFENTIERFRNFAAGNVKIIGHNLKFDCHVFANHGINIDAVYFDTMVASYVINPGRRSHSLNNLTEEYFNYKMQPITELIGSGSKQMPFAMVSVNKAASYSAEDADYTLRLKNLFLPILVEQKLDRLFFELEMPLLKVLGQIERNGVSIDIEFLKQLSDIYGRRMADIETEIYREAGQTFNINSPSQLREILFEKLRLPSSRKTAKGGEKSTDVSVLEKLAPIHPLPRLILDYRQLAKLKSTYIDALPLMVNPRTGRVHTSFNQTVTATGRLSSSDPNLQNIPIRTAEGKEIRKAFIADIGFNILSADYSQIELRLMAHFAGDKALIDSFKKGEDIHRRTAAEVFGVKLENVTEAMRRSAKTANFAIIYGVSAYGLSQQSELSVKESQDYIDAYFQRYPGVKKYMDDIKAFAREKGYVETLLKRRRYLPDINSKSRQAREFAERTAINTPIQGTAADLIKLAMIKISSNLADKKSKMILQVHDELVFEQAETEKDFLRNMVKSEMESALTLNVPIRVDISEGQNWLEAH
jgi:DNA polymerase-1